MKTPTDIRELDRAQVRRDVAGAMDCLGLAIRWICRPECHCACGSPSSAHLELGITWWRGFEKNLTWAAEAAERVKGE